MKIFQKCELHVSCMAGLGMVQEKRSVVFHRFEYVFHMINKGQIHSGIISKETKLNTGMSTKLYLHPIIYEIGM